MYMFEKGKLKHHEILKGLLAKNREMFHIEHGPHYTNHLSAGLAALHLLGATDQRLEEFFEKYSKKNPLEPRQKSQGRINAKNWKDHLGDVSYFADYEEFFKNEDVMNGWKNTLDEHLPVLYYGMGGAILHPIIHIGYGIEVCDEGTIVEGLAYLASRYLYIGALKEPKYHSLKPLDILEKVRCDERFNQLDKKNLKSTQKMKVLFEEYGHILSDYDISFPKQEYFNSHLKSLYCTLLSLFVSTNCQDFFILHTITCLRGIRNILQCLGRESQLELLKLFWRCVVCIYIARGRPKVQEAIINDKQVEGIKWEDVFATAIDHDEVHVNKFVFVCGAESREFPKMNNLFLYASKEILKVLKEGWEYE